MTLGELQAAVRLKKRELKPIKLDGEIDGERINREWCAYCAKKRLLDAALICEQHGLHLGTLAADLEKEIR